MKEDERALLRAVQARGKAVLPSTLELSQGLGIPYKRARYIVLKWSGKDWYDYGISWRVGWLTEEGRGVSAD